MSCLCPRRRFNSRASCRAPMATAAEAGPGAALRPPASVVLAAALAANPTELKRRWHLLGESLTRVQFAYVCSHFLGSHARGESGEDGSISSRAQTDLLAGVAELFGEAIVSQADKSTISWRAFSQALVSATLAAGRPPRIASDARVATSRVTIEGTPPSRMGAFGNSPSSNKDEAAPLAISAETALYLLPHPMNRLLTCETAIDVSNSGTRFRASLWQLNRAHTPGGLDTCSRTNVLEENAPLVSCVAVVPTLPTTHRAGGDKKGPSVAALTTALTIAVGSAHRTLTLWLLAAPPGASQAKRKFRIDETVVLSTPSPVCALVAGRSAAGKALLYGGSSAGQVLCWDVATWQVKQTYAAQASEVSSLLYLPCHDWIAAAYSDGTLKLWPHGASLGDRHSASSSSATAVTRGIACLAWSEQRQQLMVAAARRVHVWNPLLAERVASISGHSETLVSVVALDSIVISADISGAVRVTDAVCYEHLQEFHLCAGPIPLNVAPTLHQAFVCDLKAGEILVTAAGALFCLRRVKNAEALLAYPLLASADKGGQQARAQPQQHRPTQMEGESASAGRQMTRDVPVRALVFCQRLSRILAIFGQDVRAYDAASGVLMGVASEVCSAAASDACPSPPRRAPTPSSCEANDCARSADVGIG